MEADYPRLMGLALEEARQGFEKGEVPVGALIVSPEGRILSRAHNQPISLCDPSAHAEILALREAGARVGNYRLTGFTLVVTIEPCLMCMGAALHARLAKVVYGAGDPKGGAAGSLYDVSRDERLNHQIEVISGIRGEECARLIQRFFSFRRQGKKSGEVPKWS
ncbi:MAG: nucleoside deaminase [Deltaproteobacteria bacterium]|nr:nucleoside deaminase [Deltaproteobacteria bacterium]MBW2017966.1 nucleoside deaminase [Deltaproteobacteria bacterium]MBW2130560.1 nucleoside deaminase [Deltaproteobacteria bacterium]MBW2303387.1 nucleoside deaminase [Deltaproteobacteria bacterium]